MRLIILEEARAGDEVAEPVKNDRGIVILPEGAKLTLSLISRLQKMGVKELLVEGDDPNAPHPRRWMSCWRSWTSDSKVLKRMQ